MSLQIGTGLAFFRQRKGSSDTMVLSKSISICVTAAPKSPVPVVWNFTPKQLQYPDEVTEWLKKDSKEVQPAPL